MAEIATRGPIACALCVNDKFEGYTGGIFNDPEGDVVIAVFHLISHRIRISIVYTNEALLWNSHFY